MKVFQVTEALESQNAVPAELFLEAHNLYGEAVVELTQSYTAQARLEAQVEALQAEVAALTRKIAADAEVLEVQENLIVVQDTMIERLLAAQPQTIRVLFR